MTKRPKRKTVKRKVAAITAERIANMPQREFLQFMKKLESDESLRWKVFGLEPALFEKTVAESDPWMQNLLAQVEGYSSRLDQALKDSLENPDARFLKFHQMVARYKREADAFAVERPDFPLANEFLIAARYRHLESLSRVPKTDYGRRMLHHRLTSQVREEERDLVEQTHAEGKDAAARVYEMAKVYGYKPPRRRKRA